MTEYLLHIDETGTPSPSYNPNIPYILSGVVIEKTKQAKLERIFDKLKKKYWGNSDIVFHSEDIGKNMNECKIFRSNPALKDQFLNDLFEALHKAPVISFHAIADKTKITSTWAETTLIKKTGHSIIYNFLTYLLTRPTDSKGKIIIEASTAFKDTEYLKAFTLFLSPGCKLLDKDYPDYRDIRKRLTQISFVTKLNNDTETQIADILAYGAYCKFLQYKGASFSVNSYKGRITKMVDEKSFVISPGAKGKTNRLLKKMDSFHFVTPNK